MSIRFTKILIVVLAILTLCNIGGIIYIDALESSPKTFTQTTVLGTVFNQPTGDPTIIDIPLVRPPRTSANPGDIIEQDVFLTNNAEVNIYFRAKTKLIIERNGEKINGFDHNVILHINDGWKLKDGYYYYLNEVEPGKKIDSPIKSIEYTGEFADHLDYQVYIPIVIESVECNDVELFDVKHWPKYNINKVDYKRFGELALWKTSVTIIP